MSKKSSSALAAENTHESVSLYRKYRPHTFADVRPPQDQIAEALKSSIAQGKVAHAYLFAGGRGTGKTSLARIFARALDTSDNDLYEIDAASNRGIDDIRELREGVTMLPFSSRYKIYIIDEVHMLTKEAFNALLKTLEEPPQHALFILATTEIEKLPETIVSRCQVFTFKKPTQEVLRELVESVAKKEGFSLESGVADLVALLGDGSFRDTHGTLQKILTSAGDAKKAITLLDAEHVTGAPKSTLVNRFVKGFVQGEPAEALGALHTAESEGIEMKLFLTLILEKLRFSLLLKVAPALASTLSQRISKSDFELVSLLAKDTEKPVTSGHLAALLAVYDDVVRGAIPALPIEIAVVKMSEK